LVGDRCIHTTIDDRTRIAPSEILDDDQAITTAAFRTKPAAWFYRHGIEPRRVPTEHTDGPPPPVSPRTTSPDNTHRGPRQ
jgi:hypothetical protein